MTAQAKVVNKLLTDTVDEIAPLFCVEDTELTRRYRAISGSIPGEILCDSTLTFVKGLTEGYNNFYRHLDLYRALLTSHHGKCYSEQAYFQHGIHI